MRKMVIALGILLVIAMVLPVMAVPAVQKATGGGFYKIGDAQYVKSFTAQKDANGVVKGQWQGQSRPTWGTWHADVTELYVVGNWAFIGGVIRSAPDPDSPIVVGTQVCMIVVDNGQGKGAVDQMTSTYAGYGVDYCFTLFNPTFYDFTGNIQVN